MEQDIFVNPSALDFRLPLAFAACITPRLGQGFFIN
jgi:hypothetical protein